MSDNQSNNKRIAKNTLLLYARMLYSLFISLFTSRVILAALGFDDYGLYNVIGSVVMMFVFLRSAMGNSVHRFITYAIGKGDEKRLGDIFSMSLMIHTGLAVLIVILCETAGLWFLNTQMIIPAGREIAANWVFQFSIIACALSVICVPYDAEIIAHEKMGIFAFIQILQSTLNLAIVFAVKYYSHDKLIFYAFLLLMVQVLNRIIYGVYCGRNFPETKFHIVKDKGLFKEMMGFAGWSLFGNLAYVCNSQGQNILLNIFFGPAVNAARGIAFSVQSAVKGFVTNFQMALNPQITKSYAREDFDRLQSLIFTSSRLSFCLLWCMVLPVLFEAETLLYLWLKEVPDHAVNFLRLIVIIMMIDSLENPVSTSVAATGKIRNYQIVVGCLQLLIIPISYCALLIKQMPEYVFYVHFLIIIIAQYARLLFAQKLYGLNMTKYFRVVMVPCILMLVMSSLVAYLVTFSITPTTLLFFLKCGIDVIVVISCSYMITLEKNERAIIKHKIKHLIHKA